MKKLMILLFSAAAVFAQPNSAADPVADPAATVFSVRPELVSGFKAMGIGASMEYGSIIRRNLYLTGELSGGARYFGVKANIGKYLETEWGLKNVFGGIAGFHNTLHPVEFKDTQTGETLKTKTGNNIGIAGGFWKIMLGRKHNFDITNKIMLGYRKNPSEYDGATLSYSKGFDMKYMLSIGYTLTGDI